METPLWVISRFCDFCTSSFLFCKKVKMSAPAAAAKKFTSFYRQTGMTYLDMLSSASVALRRVLKEPQRTEAMSRSNYKYREFVYSEGREHAPSKY